MLVWRAAPLFWTISVALPLSLTVSAPPSLIFVFIASPLAETVCIPPSLIVVSFATPSTICSPPVSVVPVAVAFVLTISRPPILTCVLSEEVSDSTVNTPPFASRILFAAPCSMLNATPSARVPVTRVALVVATKAPWLLCCIPVALPFSRTSSVPPSLSTEFSARPPSLTTCEPPLIMEPSAVPFAIICCRPETISVLIALP